MLERACAHYGIEIEWRPIKTPRYGGHSERLLGTFATEIHTLPGATFSNPTAHGEYNAEGPAALKLSNFKRWLTTFIVQIYPRRVHSALDMSPADKYQDAVFEIGGQGGVGLPPRIVDEERLRLDFMPFAERSVQDYALMIDWIGYSHAVLRPCVGAKCPEDASRKRVFTSRCDPRDLSVVWFYDPELQAFENARFPDLDRKSVWVEDLDVALSADILFNRRDGSVEHLTFGAPASAGAGRAVDVIATPNPTAPGSPERLPAVLRQALRDALQRLASGGEVPRIEMVVPPGFTEPVFISAHLR